MNVKWIMYIAASPISQTHNRVFPFYKADIFPIFIVIPNFPKTWLFLDLSGFKIWWSKAETDIQLDSPLNTESLARTWNVTNSWRLLDTVGEILRRPELASPALSYCSAGSQVTESPALWKTIGITEEAKKGDSGLQKSYSQQNNPNILFPEVRDLKGIKCWQLCLKLIEIQNLSQALSLLQFLCLQVPSPCGSQPKKTLPICHILWHFVWFSALLPEHTSSYGAIWAELVKHILAYGKIM